MFAKLIILLSVLIAFRMWNMAGDGEEISKGNKVVANGSDGGFAHFWQYFIDHYGLPFLHICISILYALYMRFTLFNVVCWTCIFFRN